LSQRGYGKRGYGKRADDWKHAQRVWNAKVREGKVKEIL